MRTNNGDFTFTSSNSSLLDFFSKAGSLMEKRGTYYGNESSALELFKEAWRENDLTSMKLAFWLRDCRGGAGNRSGFRSIVKWLSENYTNWVLANIHLIPEVGRWDDLLACVDTPAEGVALRFWANAILNGEGLAAKWAPRHKNKKLRPVFNKMRKMLGLDPKAYRKLLVENTEVVETLMCGKRWNEVEYNKVPSVAMARYNKKFAERDPSRFSKWKSDLSKPDSDAKVNASVLFPHDIIRSLMADKGLHLFDDYYGRSNKSMIVSELADAQFAALPDYMDANEYRIMPICDFSASMDTPVSGSVTALMVSLGLGLYCSDRVGKDNPFYKMFIPFSTDSKLVNWKDYSFSQAVSGGEKVFGIPYLGSTNISLALDRILDSAQMFGASNDQIPNMLLIISDMQFDQGAVSDHTSVEASMKKWAAAGYDVPTIVYWNTAGYTGSPAKVHSKNVCLVSGFSPSILEAILSGNNVDPMGVLEAAIAKYEVTAPAVLA